MNPAFNAYTPRVRPLEYDALKAKEGCEPDSGTDYFGVLAFDEFCVQEDATDYAHGQQDTVSYAQGPATPGSAVKPHLVVWTAWVAAAGIRIGKVGRITPPAASSGAASALYPTTKPTKLSHAFSQAGLLAIAIQKTSTGIELKQYTDDEGTIATFTWDGYSAVLWNSGLLAHNDPAQGGLVCYYLRAGREDILYARFAAEAWATERIVMPSMRVELSRLVGVTVANQKAELRALDADGRAATLKSPQYGPTIEDAANLDITLDSGIYHASGADAPDQLDNSTLAISFEDGLYADTVVTPSNQPDTEKSTVAVELDGGEYTKA